MRVVSYFCLFHTFRYSRDYVVEGEPYAGYDRHNAEVAAFHLDRCVGIIECLTFILTACVICQWSTDVRWSSPVIPSLCRILGFRRAPLVVGRYINLRTEIKPVATDQLLSTFLMQGDFLSTHS